jgi:hypothetical protein
MSSEYGEFQDPFHPPGKLLPEQVKITQREADKTVRIQEESAQQRHALLDREKIYKERQQSYLRILALKKELRIAEQQFQELYKEPVKEVPKKNKKERSMILRDGVFVELE